VNWPILVVAVGFYWLQNTYFGWNAAPRTDAELLADGITSLLFAMAFLA
jgi:hypothetical protein